MSAYKSFAVVGAGTIGLPIVKALAAQNASVILLSRPESAIKAVPSGVQVVKVDYNDASAVAAIFKQHKVDVVLSTLNTGAAEADKSLVEASKQASVKLFAPSEYGFSADGQTKDFLGAKNRFAESLKAAGIPFVRFYVGLFIEFIPWVTGYAEHGKIRIVGKGDVPVSFTAAEDIAGFVAHVLTTLSPSELENRVFRLEGDRASFNDLGVQFKTTVEYVDRIDGDAGEIKTLLLSYIDTGAGSTGWDGGIKAEGSGSKAAGSAKAFWPGHTWKTIKDVHNL